MLLELICVGRGGICIAELAISTNADPEFAILRSWYCTSAAG